MILSRANFLVAAITSTKNVELFKLHIADDGTTVASDGKALIACSPVMLEETGELESADVLVGGVCIEPGIARHAVRLMPKERGLQLALVDSCTQDGMELRIHDRTKRQKLKTKLIPGLFPKWRTLFARAANDAQSVEIALPKRRLLRLLKALDEASGDKNEDSPVFIRFGGSTDVVVLRVRNYATKQRLVGLITPLEFEPGVSKLSKWERVLFGMRRKIRRKK